ncbi:hypothetical protein GDO86_016984 [Hymenochirus boettgeri]|uniref:TRAF3 interacting protein 1 n=1 Tax=Hymenochirus boettgeri TaxID=247094 RepID=A0A8T2IKQ7_9PIPI|nr:hypothetical protein GDO86_016984 [Hymenochirus boettgeri]
MEPDIIRSTQESLGKVIRKPPLTEKLLGKPPFRYLHDILTEDKEAKIIFLQKAIDVVVLVSGQALTVKPARIVAGHEPEKTNELLQAIAKCCLAKLSCEEAVRRVLAGERPDPRGKPLSTSKSQDKVNRETKEDDRKRDRQDKRETEIRERSDSRDRKEKHQGKEERKQEKEKLRKKETDKDQVGEIERNGFREGEKTDKEKRSRNSKSEAEREKIKEKEQDKLRENRSDGNRGKEKDRRREKERDNEKERSKERDSERDKRKERLRENEANKGKEEETLNEQEGTEKKPKDLPKNAIDTPVKDGKSTADKERLSRTTRTSRPSASKLRERRPARLGIEGESGSEGEKESAEIKETPDLQSPNINQSRRIPRPGSARPAPPRVRRQESAETSAPERLGSGKVSNVIVDKEKEDNDDEEFVVEESPLQLPDMPEMELGKSVELHENDNHGLLVKKILETKKDYETQLDTENKEKLIVSDTGRKKEKDMVTREIEKLRGSIQTLCRSALPLGKIMDYVQEDMDTMQNERKMWRQETKQHAKSLLQEQSVTDAAVEPLKAELSELEQLIKEQQDKICTVKGNILRNEEKIQKMVLGINTSSRA